MPELVLHPAVEQALAQYKARPTHALMLVGEAGIGKGSLLTQLSAQLLGCSPEALATNAGLLHVTGEMYIGIDEIRKIQHFLALKPADVSHAIRVIRIENAGRMTAEAQNALLKSIEEPPADSHILLSTTSANELLPTILSRVQTLQVHKPPAAALKDHFLQLGKAVEDIDRAYVMAHGLPGAMAGLLSGDSEHPLLVTAETARTMLQSDKFQRLIAVDTLAKDRESALRVCAVLAQMSEISLRRNGLPASQAERWQAILAASNEAERQLRANAQAKLTLTAMSLQM